MIVYTKHRDETETSQTSMNQVDVERFNWKSSTVKLSDIYLGDSRNKLADAVHNTSDDDLIIAFAATNRLYVIMQNETIPSNDEIEHYQIMKNLMENELCIRLRSGRVCRLVLAQTETD